VELKFYLISIYWLQFLVFIRYFLDIAWVNWYVHQYKILRKFCIKEKKERKGRNPATVEDMMLKSRRVVTFRCSGRLKEKINS
jgi:hypothetical protein